MTRNLENHGHKSLELLLPSYYEVGQLFFDELKVVKNDQEIKQFEYTSKIYRHEKIHKKKFPKKFDEAGFIDHLKETLGAYLLEKAKKVHAKKPSISEFQALSILTSKYAKGIGSKNIAFTKNFISQIFDFTNKESLQKKKKYNSALKHSTSGLVNILKIPKYASLHSGKQIDFFPLGIKKFYHLIALAEKSDEIAYTDILQLKDNHKFTGTNYQYFELLEHYANYVGYLLGQKDVISNFPIFGHRYNLAPGYSHVGYHASPVVNKKSIEQVQSDKLLQSFLMDCYVKNDVARASETELDITKISDEGFLQCILDAEDFLIGIKKRFEKDQVLASKSLSAQQITNITERARDHFRSAGGLENNGFADLLEASLEKKLFSQGNCYVAPYKVNNESYDEPGDGSERSIGGLFGKLYESSIENDPRYIENYESTSPPICITCTIGASLQLILTEIIDELGNVSYNGRIYTKQGMVPLLQYQLHQNGGTYISKSGLTDTFEIVKKELSHNSVIDHNKHLGENPSLIFEIYENLMTHINSVGQKKRSHEVMTLFKKFRFVNLPTVKKYLPEYVMPDTKLESKNPGGIDEYFFNNIPSCPENRTLKNISRIPVSESYLVSFASKQIRINFLEELVRGNTKLNIFIENLHDQQKKLSQDTINFLKGIFSELQELETGLWNDGINKIREHLHGNLEIANVGSDRMDESAIKELVDQIDTILETALDTEDKESFLANYLMHILKLKNEQDDLSQDVLECLRNISSDLLEVEDGGWNDMVNRTRESLHLDLEIANIKSDAMYESTAKELVDEIDAVLETALDTKDKQSFLDNHVMRKDKLDTKKITLKNSIDRLERQKEFFTYSKKEKRKVNNNIKRLDLSYKLLSQCVKGVASRLSQFKKNVLPRVRYYDFPPEQIEFAHKLLHNTHDNLRSELDIIIDDIVNDSVESTGDQLVEVDKLRRMLKSSFDTKISELSHSGKNVSFFDMRDKAIKLAVNNGFQRPISDEIKRLKTNIKGSVGQKNLDIFIKQRKADIQYHLELTQSKIWRESEKMRSKILKNKKGIKHKDILFEKRRTIHRISEEKKQIIQLKKIYTSMTKSLLILSSSCNSNYLHSDRIVSPDRAKIHLDLTSSVYDRYTQFSAILHKIGEENLPLKSINTNIEYLKNKQISEKTFAFQRKINVLVTLTLEEIQRNRDVLTTYSEQIKKEHEIQKKEYEELFTESMNHERSKSKKYQECIVLKDSLKSQLQRPFLRSNMVGRQNYLEEAIVELGKISKETLNLQESERNTLLSHYKKLLCFIQFKVNLFGDKKRFQETFTKTQSLFHAWHTLTFIKQQMVDFYSESLNFASFLSDDEVVGENVMNQINLSPRTVEKMYNHNDLAKSFRILKDSGVSLNKLIESTFQWIEYLERFEKASKSLESHEEQDTTGSSDLEEQSVMEKRISLISYYRGKIGGQRMYNVMSELGIAQYVMETRLQSGKMNDLYERLLQMMPGLEKKLIEVATKHSRFVHEKKLEKLNNKLSG